MTHASLFSGIGGFDLAAAWMGWENVFQVEIDPFCNKVLEKHFPETKRYLDVKTFDALKYRGTIDVLTGGFPCQPFSSAGSRRGTEDDRHLWPEMLRIIRQIHPRVIVAENVRGLLTIEKGLVLKQVCIDLENEGYWNYIDRKGRRRLGPFVIPACAVNAPHRRDRIWFIGYSEHIGLNGPKNGEGNFEGIHCDPKGTIEVFKPQGSDRARHSFAYPSINISLRRVGLQRKPIEETSELGDEDLHITHAESNGNTRRSLQDGERISHFQEREKIRREMQRRGWNRDWTEVAAELCRMDDGLSVELDGFKLTKAKHRDARFKSLGNAIVPQVAYEIFKSLTLL